MTEFVSPGFNLPPRLQAYGKLTVIYTQLLEKYVALYEETNGEPMKSSPEDLGYIPFKNGIVHPIEIPSVGADSISFFGLMLEGGEGVAIKDKPKNHRLALALVELHSDGSHYVAEEDILRDEDICHSYALVFSREAEPYIVNDVYFGTDGWITAEKLLEARKVPLTDQECMDFIELLQNVEDELDISISHFG